MKKSISTKPLYGKTLEIKIDITPENEKERELMKSESFIENLLFSFPNYVLHSFVGREGNIFTFTGEKEPKGLGSY